MTNCVIRRSWLPQDSQQATASIASATPDRNAANQSVSVTVQIK